MHLNLFVARKEKRKSQRDLAQIIGTSAQTYHLKETGKREFLLKEALMLSSYFDQKVEDLFENSEEKCNG